MTRESESETLTSDTREQVSLGNSIQKHPEPGGEAPGGECGGKPSIKKTGLGPFGRFCNQNS